MHYFNSFSIPAVILLLTSLGAQAAETKPAMANKVAIKKIVFQLQEAVYDIRAQFDDESIHQGTSSNLTLSLRVEYPLDVNIVAVDEIKLSEALMDSGETVIPKPVTSDHNHGNSGNRGNFTNDKELHYGYFQIPLLAPNRPFSAIKSVTGIIALSVAGTAKNYNLKPISKYIGKGLALDGLNGAEVVIAREKNGKGITLMYPRDLETRLKDVTFSDAGGRPIRIGGWSSSSNGTSMSRTYTSAIPDDGVVAFTFHGDVAIAEVPISIKNIPMSTAKNESREKIRISATP